MSSDLDAGPAAGDDDPDETAMVAAALRADTADAETYARVLTETLGEALPAGMVRVERDRSLSDRLAGRPGRVVRLSVTGTGRRLVLDAAGRSVRATVVREVRGVVIARDEVDLAGWLDVLAAEVTAAARSSAVSREALRRFLG